MRDGFGSKLCKLSCMTNQMLERNQFDNRQSASHNKTQECIPIGCVPSTAVVISCVCVGGGGVCLGVSAHGMGSAWGCLPKGVC